MNKIFEAGYIFKSIPIIIQALPLTLVMMAAALLIGLFLGLFLTVVRLKKAPVLNTVATGYISFMRGTPVLVQLFLIYYGLPVALKQIGIDINSWNVVVFAIITFGLNSSSFLSEIMRSAYLGVDIGQHEAAISIGMGNLQAFQRIIIPQAFAIALPNLGNSTIGMLKETSLAFTIGVVDIMGKTQILSANGYGVRQLEVFIAVSILYWVVSFAIEKGVGFLEKLRNQSRRLIAGQ